MLQYIYCSLCMPIYQKRLDKILQEITHKYISKGKTPNDKDILNELQEKLNDIDITNTLFKYKPVMYKDEFDNNKINDDVNAIYDEISILYDEIRDNAIAISNKQAIYESKILSKKNLVKKLKEEAAAIIATKNSYLYSNCVFDAFIDNSKIDSQKSTVEINNIENYACIPMKSKVSSIHKQYNIALIHKYGTSIEDILKEEIEGNITEYEDFVIANDLLVNNNNSIKYRIYSKNKNGAYMKITVLKDLITLLSADNKSSSDINTLASINGIKLEFENNDNIVVNILHGTNVNGTKYNLNIDDNNIVFKKSKTILFDNIYANILYFTFYKETYDKTITTDDGTTIYVYEFVIKNISTYSYSCPNEAVLISKRLFPINENADKYISTATLYVDEELPISTEIEYYIAAYSNNDDNINWIRVSPKNNPVGKFPTVVDFNQLKINRENNVILDSVNNKVEALCVGENKIYNLFATEDEIVKCEIIKGIDSIKISCGDIINDNYVEINNIYKRKPKDGIIFNEQELIQKGLKYNAYKISFIVEMTSATEIKHTISSNSSVRIYINNNELYCSNYGDSEITYTLLQGKNKIDIICYNAKNNSPILINFTNKLFSHDNIKFVYAFEDKMKEISTFDLMYNTKFKSNNFAIERVNQNTLILINDDNTEIPYYIEYTIKEKNIDSLLFKAVFKKNSESTSSPKLLRYIIYIN